MNDANVPSPVLSRARTLAAEMFAGGRFILVGFVALQAHLDALGI